MVPFNTFRSKTCSKQNFEKENARVIHEPNFENSETFEESFVVEMPDPAKEMVEPESKDRNDQFFPSRIASLSSIAIFLERSMFTLNNAQKFILKRNFPKRIFIGKRLKFVKPSTSSACRLSRWPRRVGRTFTASLACTRT